MTHLGAQGGVLTSRRRAVCLAIVGSLLAIVTLAEVRGHENVDGGQGLPAENQQRIALLEGVQNSNKNPNWDGMLTWSQPHAAALKKYPYQSLVAHLQPANQSTTLWVAPYVTKFNLTLDSSENSASPRPDQLPIGASVNTWPNIVQNKKDVLFCTKLYKDIQFREKCIVRLTRHGVLAKDEHKANAVLKTSYLAQQDV